MSASRGGASAASARDVASTSSKATTFADMVHLKPATVEQCALRAGFDVERDGFLDDAPGGVGQAELAALIFVGQALVIDPQAPQALRVQIVDVHGILRDVVAVMAGFARRNPGIDPAAPTPD